HDGEALVCLELHTGAEKWRSAPITGRLHTVSEEAPTTVLGENAVFFVWNKHTTAVSRADGKTLWENDWPTNDYRSPVTLMLMNGLVWSMNITSARAPGTFIGREPVSGEIVKQFDLPPFQGIGHHRCYKAKASGDFVLLSRSGVEYVDPSKESYAEHHWVRGACLYGIMPANGMLYSTPHACACYIKGKLNGFTALRPGPTGPSPLAKPGEGPTEKGEAFGRIQNSESGIQNGEWPTYRGDVGRSGHSGTSVTTELKESWSTDVGGELSALTVAGGLVFVAQKDRNTIQALDAGTGKPAWAYTAGGTVDSPPTIDRGRAYFGCADGSVYCLRAADGALLWRTRAAPAERRVIAYGRVESSWPVNGSVLVQGGAVYCAAGRSSFLDGGIRIVKIDADSGNILMSQNVYDLDEDGEQPPLEGSFDMAGALPDILSGDGGSVFMRHLRFGRELLDPQEPAPHLFSPTGYLDANWWHRTHWVYGADTKAGYGGWWKEGNKLPAGRLMVFDDDSVYCFGRSFYAGMNAAQFSRGEKYILYAAEKREGPEPDWDEINKERRRVGDLSLDWKKYRTTPIKWSGQIPFNVRAMALADQTLFTSGPYGDALRSMDSFRGKRGVRLAATNIATGEMVASWAIEPLPVFDGLAAAGGSLFLAGSDGSVRAFCAKGVDLESKLGEPIEILPEELLTSDEDYRKRTEEFLGDGKTEWPRSGAKGKGKAKRKAPAKGVTPK
ncbi:MAG: PQQ-binding-like beta-propeller repeat protein, partial [Verrucomicrobiales bacterium]